MTLTRKLQRMKECQLNQHLFVRFMSGRSLTSTWKSNLSTSATLNQEELFSQNSYSHLYLSPFRRLHLFGWDNKFIFSYIPSSWQIIFARALLIRPYPGSVCFVWHFWDFVILNLSTAWCLLETLLSACWEKDLTCSQSKQTGDAALLSSHLFVSHFRLPERRRQKIHWFESIWLVLSQKQGHCNRNR